MSVDVLREVLRSSQAKGVARNVLTVLADAAHVDGVTWMPIVPSKGGDPSRCLTHRANASKRAVIAALQSLEDLGEVEVRQAQRSRRRINVYRVVVGAVAATPVDYSDLPFELERPFADEVQNLHLVQETETPRRGADSARRGAVLVRGAEVDLQEFAGETAVCPPPEAPMKRSSPADAGEGTASAALGLAEIPEILEEKFGRVVPRTNAHARRRKAIADLRRLEATPETVRQAIVAWDGRFPGATLTDIALATHFPQLAAAAAPRQAVPVDPAAVSRSRARDAATGVVLALRRSVCPECEVGGGRHFADCAVATETPARAYRRWVTDHAADTGFPLEEVHLVIDEWRDLDDVDRGDLHDLATETRARIPHAEEEAA